jgi:hypothetical protein
MGRWAALLFTVLSGLLCALFEAAWLRSFWVATHVYLFAGYSRHMLTSERGGLVYRVSGAISTDRWSGTIGLVDGDWLTLPAGFDAKPSWSFAGFSYSNGRQRTVPTEIWRVPYWFPTGAAAACFALLLRSFRLRGISPGHCLSCGYDLRASPEKCPECGAAAPSGKSAAKG